MRFIASGASVIGPRHLELNEENQDAMVLSGWKGGWIAAVADGLGSKVHSALGSRSACQVSRNILRSSPEEIHLESVIENVHRQWLKKITPFDAAESSTTLLLARISNEGKVYAGQLGDGLLLVRTGGIFRCVTPERTGYGNQTRALDKALQPKNWAFFEGSFSQPGDGVVLLTDGVGDDIMPDDLPEFFDALYMGVLSRTRRRARQWIASELKDWPTPMHSDDKTIVAIFRNV